jgi:hypothetical protein
MPETYILNHFIRHLKRDIQKKVELQQPLTLELAMKMADRIDCLEYNDRRQSNGYVQSKWTPRPTMYRGSSTSHSSTNRSRPMAGFDPDQSM